MTLHVWIIEDDKDLGEMLERHLLHQRMRVSRFSEGKSALATLDATDALPDVVCLDLALPDISGFEVCARLRAHARAADVPILVITARTSLEDHARADEVGADAYMEKPIRLKAFMSAIESMTSTRIR